jgi:hypothetical protein
MRMAEPGCRVEALEPEHGMCPLLDGPLPLLHQILGVAGRAMRDRRPKLKANRAGVGGMEIRGHLERTAFGEQAGGAEEGQGAGRSHVSLKRTSSKFPS